MNDLTNQAMELARSALREQAERIERLEEALRTFVDCNFTYFEGRVIGTDARLTKELVERARAILNKEKK